MTLASSKISIDCKSSVFHLEMAQYCIYNRGKKHNRMQVKVGGVDTFTIGIKCFVILIKLKKPEMRVFCFQHLEHEMVI